MGTSNEPRNPHILRNGHRLGVSVGVIACVLASLLLSMIHGHPEEPRAAALGAAVLSFGIAGIVVSVLGLRRTPRSEQPLRRVFELGALIVAASVITLLLSPILLGVNELGPLSPLVGAAAFVGALLAVAANLLFGMTASRRT